MAENPKPIELVTLAPLPMSAVQALYHAATGKTENLRKSLTRNVLVKKSDLDQLRIKIHQQLEHFILVSGPTETVNISFTNQERQQFSSWERFDLYDSNKTEVINDVTLKFEFLIRLPGIENPQRYIISVNIDSKLAMVSEEDHDSMEDNLWWLESYPNLNVSIDFIDYLCAKNFSQIVEEWFNSLEEVVNKKWILKIRKSSEGISDLFHGLANLGIATFIVVYVSSINSAEISATRWAYFVATSIIVYTISTICIKRIGRSMLKTIGRSIRPASVILTVGDQRAFKRIDDKSLQVISKTIFHLCAAILAVFLNIVASYLYTWLTFHPR